MIFFILHLSVIKIQTLYSGIIFLEMDQINQENIIKQVVEDFYELAVNDVFIGYHFRKISSSKLSHATIISSLHDFKNHLPKIEDFWCAQLLPKYTRVFDRPHVLKVHEYLGIRVGELGRWLTLFREVLNKYDNEINHTFINLWLQKVDTFEKAFREYYFKK